MQATKENPTTTKVNSSPDYECEVCKDMEWILDGEGKAHPCECREVKLYGRILAASGISNTFKQKTFCNFERRNKRIDKAKTTAQQYASDFQTIKQDRHNSIAFLGRPGSGKTHLSIAIANELMNLKVGVLYMPYREAIIKLKQCVMDDENYNREIGKYKLAPVLMIDDLFKGKKTESDLNIMFEIINHRYLKSLPMIISSELLIDDLIEFDEATGSRIVEMCRGRILELTGEGMNYRLT